MPDNLKETRQIVDGALATLAERQPIAEVARSGPQLQRALARSRGDARRRAISKKSDGLLCAKMGVTSCRRRGGAPMSMVNQARSEPASSI